MHYVYRKKIIEKNTPNEWQQKEKNTLKISYFPCLQILEMMQQQKNEIKDDRDAFRDIIKNVFYVWSCGLWIKLNK